MRRRLENFLLKLGLPRHRLYYYQGFAGVPGYKSCLVCGQPWKDLGIPLDMAVPCPGSEYGKVMREKTEKLWRDRVNHWKEEGLL